MKTEKYQPSNSSEGMYFCEKFCDHCVHQDPNIRALKNCDIFLNTLVFDVKDPEYPEEWTYDKNGEPTCTKYQYWDWDEYGDPDAIENILIRPLPFNPNQLVINF